MGKRYNVYFSGQVIAGHDPATVRENLRAIFKADDPTLDKLFGGKPRMIKRDCDEATAQKYQSAMERAGAEPIVEAVVEAAAEPATGSAADKIAALAAAPADERFGQNTAPDSATKPAAETQIPPDNTEQAAQPSRQPSLQPSPARTDDDDLILAPPETAVLREDERTKTEVREIDTSNLSIDSASERLSEASAAGPDAPDTSHLDIAEAGAPIPNLLSSAAPLSPNTDQISLAPQGADFSDCAKAEAAPPELDLSGIAVAPSGENVLEEKYRTAEPPPPPATDHISLED